MKKIYVTKASGELEEFSEEKLIHSLHRANASDTLIHSILESIASKLYDGITTDKIYKEAFRLLKSQSKPNAARYNLKRGMMQMGTSGFPFERFVAELFKAQGYATVVGSIIPGKCIQHEVDIIAEKQHQLVFVECKYRNQSGFSVDVKNPLYIHSRFQDILDNGFIKDDNIRFEGWIATNTKFTEDAIAFGRCKDIRMLSWNYPNNNSLKDIVDKTGLYPLTCLTTLTRFEKGWLLDHNYILVQQVYNNANALRKAGVTENRLEKIYQEGQQLCQDIQQSYNY